ELRMEGEAVDRFLQVDQQIGLVVLRIVAKRKDLAVALGNRQAIAVRDNGHLQRLGEFQLGEGKLRPVGSRRVGRALDFRGGPWNALVDAERFSDRRFPDGVCRLGRVLEQQHDADQEGEDAGKETHGGFSLRKRLARKSGTHCAPLYNLCRQRKGFPGKPVSPCNWRGVSQRPHGSYSYSYSYSHLEVLKKSRVGVRVGVGEAAASKTPRPPFPTSPFRDKVIIEKRL